MTAVVSPVATMSLDGAIVRYVVVVMIDVWWWGGGGNWSLEIEIEIWDFSFFSAGFGGRR